MQRKKIQDSYLNKQISIVLYWLRKTEKTITKQNKLKRKPQQK